MKVRLGCQLWCAPANAESVRSAVASDLADLDVFDGGLPVVADDEPNALVILSARLNNAAHAQVLWERIVARWTSGALRNRILAGSLVSRHDCTHDDPVVHNCRDHPSYVEQVKV